MHSICNVEYNVTKKHLARHIHFSIHLSALSSCKNLRNAYVPRIIKSTNRRTENVSMVIEQVIRSDLGNVTL